tara:strand:+ start:56 stop:433 length:378 start_codon:yes stop_codon:yes gene_type:complete
MKTGKKTDEASALLFITARQDELHSGNHLPQEGDACCEDERQCLLTRGENAVVIDGYNVRRRREQRRDGRRERLERKARIVDEREAADPPYEGGRQEHEEGKELRTRQVENALKTVEREQELKPR